LGEAIGEKANEQEKMKQNNFVYYLHALTLADSDELEQGQVMLAFVVQVERRGEFRYVMLEMD
jgi:hypothetical protein